MQIYKKLNSVFDFFISILLPFFLILFYTIFIAFYSYVSGGAVQKYGDASAASENMCPLCSKSFPNFVQLEAHVDHCVDEDDMSNGGC